MAVAHIPTHKQGNYNCEYKNQPSYRVRGVIGSTWWGIALGDYRSGCGHHTTPTFHHIYHKERAHTFRMYIRFRQCQ